MVNFEKLYTLNLGLKILKKFFNNTISNLIDNLKITDKIYIKGLEQY